MVAGLESCLTYAETDLSWHKSARGFLPLSILWAYAPEMVSDKEKGTAHSDSPFFPRNAQFTWNLNSTQRWYCSKVRKLGEAVTNIVCCTRQKPS